MELSHAIEFAHDLYNTLKKHDARFLYDEYNTTSFIIGETGIHVSTDWDTGKEWEFEFAWLPGAKITNYVLEGKVKWTPEANIRMKKPVDEWVFLPAHSGINGYLLYTIDDDGKGAWVVKASAYSTTEKSHTGGMKQVKKVFKLSDEEFYSLLARAES